MANYFDAGVSEVSFLADEDLAAWQWKLVMAASSDGYVQKCDILPTATCPRMPIGVLTNSPSMGQEASVKCLGFTKGYALGWASVGGTGCPLQFGSLLSYYNVGLFRAASDDTDDPIVGIWYGPNVTSGSVYGSILLNMFPASGTQQISSNN